MLRQVAFLVAVAALAPAAAAEARPAALPDGGQLQRVSEHRSFGAQFIRYRQVVGGLPVLGSETVTTDGRRRGGDLLIEGVRRARRVPARATLSTPNAVRAARRSVRTTALRGPIVASKAILVTAAGPRAVWRVVVPSSQPLGSFEVLVDARNARILRVRDLLRRAFTASGQGSVFDTNPIVAQGSRTGLADAGDADSAALTALREEVTLARLDTTSPGCLEGRWAYVTLPSGEVCDNPDRDFRGFTRADDEFEAVMAYFHLDRAQEYIRSLGFTNVRADQQRVHADEVFLDEDDDPLPPGEQDNSF